MRKSFTYEGKRYFIRCKNEADFEVKKALRIKEVDGELKVIRKNTRVEQWFEDWIETYRPDVSRKWQKHMETLLERFCEKYGSHPIKSITQKNIQMYMNSLRGSSEVILRKNYQLLKVFFETAKDNGLVAENPVKNIKLPKPTAKESRRSITPREREIILKVASYHPFGIYLKIMLYCGLRTMEVAALDGRDIDLTKKVIHVSKTVKSDGTVGEPKTANGMREVPIPKVLMGDLEQLKLEPFKAVFINSYGNRYTQNTVQARWKSFKECMEIEMAGENGNHAIKYVADDLVMYNLRHTYCTDLQDAGVPINIAKDLMGHSSIAITSKIYTHRSEASFEHARGLIDACQGRATPSQSVENTRY